MIAAKNINYSVSDTPILDDVSVLLKPGTVTAILGPNGAGKSSLLKCLSGTLAPCNGDVYLDGASLQSYPLLDLSRRRGVLSQTTALNFPFTVLELVMMGRHPYINSRESKDDKQVVQWALESVDAWSLKDRVFPTLSGGEQQRVQLARVLGQVWGQQQACLFLDEPTAALDLKYQHQVFQLIGQLSEDYGLTVCVILHDPQLARRYCDQAILMKQGRIFTSGPIAKVLEPENIEHVYEVPPDWIGGWVPL